MEFGGWEPLKHGAQGEFIRGGGLKVIIPGLHGPRCGSCKRSTRGECGWCRMKICGGKKLSTEAGHGKNMVFKLEYDYLERFEPLSGPSKIFGCTIHPPLDRLHDPHPPLWIIPGMYAPQGGCGSCKQSTRGMRMCRPKIGGRCQGKK